MDPKYDPLFDLRGWWDSSLSLSTWLDSDWYDSTGVTNYSLVGSGGAIIISGGSAALVAARTLPGVGGSITISGGSASLVAGRGLTATGGAITIAGGAATLAATRALAGAGAAIALSGGSATLKADRVLAGAGGAIVFAGGSASLESSGAGPKSLLGESATITISGGAATFDLTSAVASGVAGYSGGILEALTKRDRDREELDRLDELPEKTQEVIRAVAEKEAAKEYPEDVSAKALKRALKAADQAYRDWYVELLLAEAQRVYDERMAQEDDEEAYFLLM